MGIVVLIVRVLLAAVFAIAGAAKLADPEGSRKSMVDFGVPPLLGRPLSILVPLAELACAAALLWAVSAPWGAAGLLAMLIVFSVAMAIVMARGRRPDCHCFGQLHSSPIGPKTLARNGVLSAMAAFVLWQGPQPVDAAALWSALSPSGSSVPALVLLFAVLQAAQLWILFNVLRQNGRLLVRLEALEANNPTSSQPHEARGLKVNTPAPGFSLPAVDGGTVTLDSLNQRGLQLAIFHYELAAQVWNISKPQVNQNFEQASKALKNAKNLMK